MIRFFHEKEEPSKMCYSQCVAWQLSFLVGCSTQIVSGRRRFNSYQSLIFFHFCYCLNCVSPVRTMNCFTLFPLCQEHLKSLGVTFRGEGSFVTDLLHSKPPIFESALPLHQPHEQEKIWNKMKQNVIVCPLQEIRDYYGKFELLSNEYYVRVDFMFIGNCTNLK